MIENPTSARLEVEVLRGISPEEFAETYLSTGRCYIIEGVLDAWPALGKWTPDYLRQTYADTEIPVWKFNPANGPSSLTVPMMRLGEYMDRVDAGFAEDEQYYAGSLPLDHFMPELKADYSLLNFAPQETPIGTVMQYGSRVFSQYHYHPFGSAILSQIYGSKTVRLSPPGEKPRMHKYPFYHSSFNLSQQALWEDVPAEGSLIAKADYVDVEINAGQILFLPIYYWHGIKNGELNIATTTFWRRKYFDRCPPPPHFLADYLWEPVRQLAGKMPKLPKPKSSKKS